MNHQNYNNKHTQIKYLINILKTRILKVINSLLELEKDFKKLKDKELNDREIKIKKETEELSLNQLTYL